MKTYWYIYEFGLGDRSTTFARVEAESLARVEAESLADAKAAAIVELGRRDLFVNQRRKLLWVEDV